VLNDTRVKVVEIMAAYSSRKADISEVRLDESGNIDVSSLSKELRDALQFDVKYKQTDNMKKKAIRQAGSYDEFRAMVACAHLKTLNRSEVESLRDVKRGWQRSHQVDKSLTAQILEQEADLLGRRTADGTSALTGGEAVAKFRKPKTVMEFERDWRRLRTDDERIAYLRGVGTKRFKSLHQCEGDAEIFEQILSTLVCSSSSTSSAPPSHVSDAESENFVIMDWVLKWLKAVTTLDKFPLLVRFIPRDLLAATLALLPSSAEDGKVGENNEGGSVDNDFKWVEKWRKTCA